MSYDTIEFTDEQIKGVVAKVEATALDRHNNGYVGEEGAFFSGAMTVIHALTSGPDEEDLSPSVPPIWALVLASGRSLLALRQEDKEKGEAMQVKVDRARWLIQNSEDMYSLLVSCAEQFALPEWVREEIFDLLEEFDYEIRQKV